MSVFAAVLRKECVDNARDRRALSTALVLPLLGPLTIGLMFLALSDVRERQTAPRVPVVGRERASQLVGHLERSGVVVVPAPEDPERAVAEGRVDVVVVIPETFAAELRAGRPAIVELIADESRQSSAVAASRVRTTLQEYGARIGALRLIARGVDPGITQAVGVAVHDIGTPQARAALLLGALPLFLLLSCFVGGTYIAIDVTAGELERGSLEALLLNPVRARDVVLAKIAATAVFSLLGVVVAAAGFVVAIAVIPFERAGFDLRLSPWMAMRMVALLLPVVVLGAAVQVFVGTLSRTFKTAQAAISFVTIAPTIPGALLAMFPQQPSLGLVLVPTVGHDVLMLRALRGEEVAAADVVLAAASVLALSALLVAATTRLFGPRLIAGR